MKTSSWLAAYPAGAAWATYFFADTVSIEAIAIHCTVYLVGYLVIDNLNKSKSK